MYLHPIHAQDILQIGESGIKKRIRLESWVERPGAFYSAAVAGSYLFLIPNLYPFVVRYDTKKEELRYFEVETNVFSGLVNGERRCGAFGVKEGRLYLTSPTDRRVLVMEAESGECQVKEIRGGAAGGYMSMMFCPQDGDFWLLPYSGNVITRWNPDTEDVREYPVSPEGFVCRQIPFGYECSERPFGSVAFYRDEVYLSPFFGNQYIRLNKNTGEACEWKLPVELPKKEKNGYFTPWAGGYWNCLMEGNEIREYRLFSVYDRKYYRVDPEKNECREIPVTFDRAELRENEPGFAEQSQWLQYACLENAFNSLPDFLDGNITGNDFDRERQLAVYRQLSANSDGTSGEKIHQFIRKKL